MTMGLQGYGQPQDWQDDMYYPVGQTVVDRGGIWRAVAANRNSEPISGNTDWTLVAGVAYVDVTLTPVDLTTAPFYDSGGSGPGVVIVPAPGTGFIAVIVEIVTGVSTGDAWGQDATVQLSWRDPASANNPSISGATDSHIRLTNTLATRSGTEFFAVPMGISYSANQPADNEDIVVWTDTDVTNSGATIGTRSGLIRVFYQILPIGPSNTGTFFTITAVDQGTQTLTVNGNAADDLAAGDTFDVVGSTANDAEYTVASIVFTTSGTGTTDTIGAVSQLAHHIIITASDKVAQYPVGCVATVAGSTGNDGDYTVTISELVTGNTRLTVAEALPSAVADGTIEEPSITEIVTVQAIPDATADGWVEVA